MLIRSDARRPASPMMPDAPFEADVVLVAPREFEITKAQRTYREKSFTTFTELLSVNAFQTDYIKRINEALGLEALASYIRRVGLRVAVLNCNVAPHTTREIAEKIRRSGARVVGISLIYRPQVALALDLLEALEGSDGLTIVMGVALASFMPRELLTALHRLDAVVYGEAEETFAALCDAACRGRDWTHLPGIAYRDRGQPLLNRPAPPLDLDRIVRPARDTLGYLKARGWHTRIASIYTSRGCMAKCTFCTGKDAYNVERTRTYRFRDPVAVVDEIEALHADFGVSYVYINDDNFLGYGAASSRRVRIIAEEILRRRLPIQFASECRVDGLDPDLLDLLKQAGMRQVLMGVESGSPSVLKRWRKGATVEQNIESVGIVRRAGLALEPGFILFDAHTTQAELRENLAFIETAGLNRAPIPTYLVNRLAVYPGTEIELLLRADGTLKPSPIRLGAGAGNDPQAVRDYFDGLEYTARDPRTEIAWRALRHAMEPVESFLEDRLPVLTGILTGLRGPTHPGDVAQHARDLIRAAGRWRRTVGDLVTEMIAIVIASYDAASHAAQWRGLRADLDRAARAYAERTLGRGTDDFIEEVASLHRRTVRLDLSVVIPTVGKWSRLRRTLAGLRRQRLPGHVRWEVVLVTDGFEAPASWGLDTFGLPLRTVPLARRRGRGAARNAGVDAAGAELVLLLDDDVVLTETALATHLAAQERALCLCHGATREVPGLVYFDCLDTGAVAPRLAERPGLARMRRWLDTALALIDADPDTAYDGLGQASRLEAHGVAAWRDGRLPEAWIAFAGANLSAPRRWLQACRFDERPGARWGLEDIALTLRLALNGRPLHVAEEARGLHLSHDRGEWKRSQRANAACLDFLPAPAVDAVLDHLEGETTGETTREAMADRLAPLFEAARRRQSVEA